MNRFNSANEEFNKIKDELINDLKIIQTEYANSQKKLKIAEEILQKTKMEYKKLNDEYTKLVDYKNKCEKFIQHLQGENNKSMQKLNNLHEKQQNHNKYKNNRNNLNKYYQLQKKHNEKLEEEEEKQEEEQEEEELEEEELEEEEDITEHENHPLIIKKKANRPPPNKIRKKIKKGISNFI